jgi:hypothetical protein
MIFPNATPLVYLLLCVGWVAKGMAFCMELPIYVLMASIVLERCTSALGSAVLDDIKYGLRKLGQDTVKSGEAKAWASRADILMRLPVGTLRVFRLAVGCHVVHIVGTKYRGIVAPKTFLSTACILAAIVGTLAFLYLRSLRSLPTTGGRTVTLILALFAVGLYNAPDGQSHVLRHLLTSTQQQALDTTAFACVLCEGAVFMGWVYTTAPSFVAVVPKGQGRAALWLILVNIVTCAALASTMLYYFTSPLMGAAADITALVIKVVLVPWLMQTLSPDRNIFEHNDVAHNTLAGLAFTVTMLAGSTTTVVRIAIVTALWFQDSLLDEYNARISTWFAAAQKNLCLLVFMYGARVYFLHDGLADPAQSALQMTLPWYSLSWLIMYTKGPQTIQSIPTSTSTSTEKDE